MLYFSSFIAKSWLNNFEDIGQGQRSSNMTHPLMLVIICAKYGKTSSRNVHDYDRTWHDVPYFSSFIAKPCLNDLGDISQDQRSLCMTHPLMQVVICANYGKNPCKTLWTVQQTQQYVTCF